MYEFCGVTPSHTYPSFVSEVTVVVYVPLGAFEIVYATVPALEVVPENEYERERVVLRTVAATAAPATEAPASSRTPTVTVRLRRVVLSV